MPVYFALADLGTAIASAGGEGTTTTTLTAAQYLENAFENVHFEQIVEGIVGIAPTVLPILITILAFKKGLSWTLRLVRRS